MRLVGMYSILKSPRAVVVLMSYTRGIQGGITVTSLKCGRVFVAYLRLIGVNYFPAKFTCKLR